MKAKREWQKGEKNNKNTNKPEKKRKSEEKIWGNSLSRKHISKVTKKRKNKKKKTKAPFSCIGLSLPVSLPLFFLREKIRVVKREMRN